MRKVTLYTDDPCEEMKAENERLRAALFSAEQMVETLERLRPHWAQGYSSDSMAAQSATTALSSVWTILGVNSQTAAMSRIRELLGAA